MTILPGSRLGKEPEWSKLAPVRSVQELARPVNLSVKDVPDALAAKLRERAERSHRSLQGELMAILEAGAGDSRVGATPADGLLKRLLAIAGSHGIDTTKRLTREQVHGRTLLRESGI